MSNFQFLLTAWIVVWAIFFGYELSVASRVATLRRDIEDLKRQLGDK
jgi:cell division protein FtsL